MNITRDRVKVRMQRWSRYQHNLISALGPDGKRMTSGKEHLALSKRAAGEGMVLLENDGVLPLKEGTKVALFGMGTLDFIKGGGGSGTVYCKYSYNVYEGFKLKEPFIKVFEPVTKFYYDYAVSVVDNYQGHRNNDELIPDIDLPKDLLDAAKKECDVAIITISRTSCEGVDRKSEKGDFYLTDAEQRTVDAVTAVFDKCVVILNVGGMVDVSWIKSNSRIGAALLAWQPGQEGAKAVADIICGEINPSGRLTDTFAKTFDDYPSADTFNKSDDYVEYFEDIYVGYRYFETVPDAKDKVNYPFGYGLSYTTFDISKPVARKNGDCIEVDVTVTNTGDRAGKEVVQVYYSAPQGVLGKSAIELGAFQKTRELAPNEKQDITLSFAIEDMASYDDLGKLQKSAYLLEGGDYRFFAGNNCRNLTQADYVYTVDEKFVVTKQLTQRCAPTKLEKRMLSDGSFEALPKADVIKHEAIPYANTSNPIESEMPISFQDVADGKISLDEFMTQITDDELIALVSGTAMGRGVTSTSGMGGNTRLGIPIIMTADGPAGIRIRPYIGIETTAFPCATLLACTWDPEIIYEIGVAGAIEAKENGLGIWLTPALNIHRNPLCGRNFEYFSEDPLISGKFAAAKVRGIQSQKIGASIKHFCVNNKEINRKWSDSRLSERALREIYLRGFEITVKESQPFTLMSSYNIVNSQRCCESFELINGILREEWGYDGLVETDWVTPCDQSENILGGGDVRMPTGDPELLKAALANGKITRGHLERSVKRLLESFLKIE